MISQEYAKLNEFERMLKMKGKVTFLFCMVLLFALGYQTTAGENDMITINIRIFPPKNQIGSIDTTWNAELQLIRKKTVEEPNGSITIIDEQIMGRKGKGADSEGRVGWKTPIQKPEVSEKQERIRYYYKVVCYGEENYNDGVSKEIDAAILDEYNVTIIMDHK
jgi:hypothetical protein